MTVVVPTRGEAGPELDAFAVVRELDVRPLMLPAGPRDAVGALLRLRREVTELRGVIRATSPDLVLVVSTVMPAALLAARRERVPAVLYAAEVHRGAEVESRLRRSVGAVLIAHAKRSARAVIACSKAAAAQFEPLSRDRLSVVYPPIAAAYAEGDGEAFRARHGIAADSDRACVLAVGNLTRGRGQDLVLRAISAVEAAGRPAVAVLAGATFDRPKDVAYEAELRTLARGLGVDARLIGFEPDIAGAYAAADVVVNAARVPESFGRASCEALAAGCPVIASRLGAAEEVLGGLSGATLVDPERPEELAAAIVESLADPEARNRAREGGAEVLERYSPERSLAGFRAAVERALEVRPAAS